jgi:hypothetical protein
MNLVVQSEARRQLDDLLAAVIPHSPRIRPDLCQGLWGIGVRRSEGGRGASAPELTLGRLRTFEEARISVFAG